MRRLAPLTLLLIPAVAAAQPHAAGPDARAATLAPFLDPGTFAVGHVNLSRVDADAALDKLGELVGLTAAERDAARAVAADRKARLAKAGVRDVYAVASLSGGFTAPGFVIVPATDGTDAAAIGAAFGLPAERIGAAVVAGPPPALVRLKTLKPMPRPELAAALAAAGDSAARVVLFPPDDLRRSVEELLPTLPAEIGGGPTKTLTRGVRWVAFGLDLSPKLAARATVQAADAEAARAVGGLFEKAVGAFVQMSRKELAGQRGADEATRGLTALASVLKLTPAGDKLTASVGEDQLLPVLRPLVAKVRGSAERARSTNQLKQLALAMHNYHDAYKGFPARAIRSKDGKPLLSWRVAILPFIEANDLYKEFRLDEPWDSEHNKKLIPRMPAVYRSPFQTGPAGTTAYLVPVGDAAIFPPAGPGVPLKDITDGTSNTVFLVEADDAHAVPWTKPDDLVSDPKRPADGLRSLDGGVFLAAFADGSVRAIRTSLDAKMLAALFTRNGGEVVSLDR